LDILGVSTESGVVALSTASSVGKEESRVRFTLRGEATSDFARPGTKLLDPSAPFSLFFFMAFSNIANAEPIFLGDCGAGDAGCIMVYCCFQAVRRREKYV
jgi:hypothetical protein